MNSSSASGAPFISLDDSSGLQIDGEVVHLAQPFALVVFDFRPDGVAGFLRAAKALDTHRAGKAFLVRSAQRTSAKVGNEAANTSARREPTGDS